MIMAPRYQHGGTLLGRGFDVADEAMDPLPGIDIEDGLEAEGLSGTAADVAVLTSFGIQGFDTTPQFRSTWITLLRNSRVSSSAGFRADFCKARHFRLKGTSKRFAVVRGFPMEYSFALSGKVLLKGIGRSTLIDPLARLGRRIPPPLPCPQPSWHWRSPRRYGLTVSFSPPGSAEVKTSERQKLFDWYFGLPSSVQAKITQGQIVIVLEGFASTTQPAAANKLLSQRRAVQVRNALMAIIGPGAKYTLYAYGESRAKTPNEVEDPKERRVQVSVTDS
jgi:OmpA family